MVRASARLIQSSLSRDVGHSPQRPRSADTRKGEEGNVLVNGSEM